MSPPISVPGEGKDEARAVESMLSRESPSISVPGEGRDEARAVESMLSRELLQLSLGERNAIEEEIHGVHCRAPQETTDLLQSSLQTLSTILDSDQIIPPHEKQAYLRSQRLSATYINSNEFRLRFLRLELFDIVKATKKMVRFLDIACFHYGDVILERPARLQDFDKKELQLLRSGAVQFLPFRDRSGRRVLVIPNPSTYSAENNEKFMREPLEGKHKTQIGRLGKLILYTLWVAGEDIDTQRKGIVSIVWFDPSFSVISTNRTNNFASFGSQAEDQYSVRLASVHFCAPDTTVHHFIAAIARLRAGSQLRLKFKTHYGENVELQYWLQSYGIPTEYLPISFSGTIKTAYIKQWMRAREMQESPIYLQQPMEFRDIIECPQHTDVLFRPGISMMRKPGNARVRFLIEEKQKEITETKGQKVIKPKRRDMVNDVIEEVRKTGRFLTWDEGGWWTELVDQEQIMMKIEYLFKDTRRMKREARQQLILQSSTSLFYRNKPGAPDGGSGENSDDDGSAFMKGCFG